MKKSALICFLFFCHGLLAVAAEPQIKKVTICNDTAEWPPYSYFERRNGEKTQKIVGFSVDLIHEIFEREGIDYEISMLPWKRCLANVKNGRVDMVLDASYNKEREMGYYISRPCYFTNSFYFYSKKHFPNGLNIKTMTQLQKYRVGGRLGFNYKPYGIENSQLVVNAKTFPSLITALHRNRCDLFIEKFEILKGYSTIITNIFSDSDLQYAPVPEAGPEPFYFMFTKNNKGKLLKKIVDSGIDRLEKNGSLQKMLQRYIL